MNRLSILRMSIGSSAERGERGVTGAEVVDRDAYPGSAELIEGADDATRLAGEDRFGDLEDELRWIEIGACERVRDVFDEVGVRELQA